MKRPLILSPQALLRYQAVSQVEARVLAGKPLAEAIDEVLALPQVDLHGDPVKLSERTLYRWTAAYRACGVAGLEPKARPRVEASAVLDPRLLEFLCEQKKLDPLASVPGLLELARQVGVLAEDELVSRVTVWRACRRLGLPLKRRQRLQQRDMRPFAYPNRMLMVLADGKHFRAGLKRRYRVALTFLDDATRYGLAAKVDTSENTELFLHGLHEVVRRHGLMLAMFLDQGPGFISDDTMAVLAQLPCRLIHGTKAYPEGHGKIEKFHQLLIDRVLRGLDRNPEIDPDPQALTLRLTHWLRESYNHRPHEGLDGDSSAALGRRFAAPSAAPGPRLARRAVSAHLHPSRPQGQCHPLPKRRLRSASRLRRPATDDHPPPAGERRAVHRPSRPACSLAPGRSHRQRLRPPRTRPSAAGAAERAASDRRATGF